MLAGTGRGSLGYWYNVGGYSRFTTTAPTTGSYVLRLRYASPEASTRTVLIDGITATTIALPATGGWGNAAWRTIDIPVTLTAGTRTIEFRRVTTDAGAVNVDNVSVRTTS